MKQLTKKCAPLYAALGLLLLAGCPNILPAPPAEQGLLITVSNGEARTLYPGANFSKYTLSFENTNGDASYADVTMTEETSALIKDIPNGIWKITAVGYVTINGAVYAAADGSVHVTVSSGSFQSANIVIIASQEGDNGFFSYSVNIPQTKANGAWLGIRNYNDGFDNHFIDLLNEPEDTIELPPGYYLMTIELYNDYHTAGRTEIVHIYSNMETRADYVFTEADLTDFITLSGTVNMTMNGQTPQYAYVYAYLDENFWDLVKGVFVDMNTGAWTMMIPAFDTATTLYFEAEAYTNDDGYVQKSTGKSAVVKASDVSGIDLGTITFNTITLSGTAAVTMDGQPLGNIEVMAFVTNKNIKWAEVETDGAWYMNILAFDQPTEVTFILQVNNMLITAGTKTVHASDISGITLTAAITPKLITGTANIDKGAVAALIDSVSSLTELMSSFDKVLGQGMVNDEQWAMNIPDTAPDLLWFVLIERGDYMDYFYVTEMALDTSGVIELDTSGMILLDY